MKLNPLLGCIWAVFISTSAFAAITPLNDAELSDVRGQALLSLTQAQSNARSDVNFFKLGAEAIIDINANIKRLQLGCGGINGAGGCDVDIENLGLSGLNDGTDPITGSPTFSNGRASTSAKITNPFIEFAIKNPTSASTREMMGFRLGAQEILGLLTLGTDNVRNPTDGLKSFTGYMKIAPTNGLVMTQETKFADSPNEELRPPARITTVFGDTTFRSDSSDNRNTGITVPSSPSTFIVPAATLNGSRQTSITISNIAAKVDRIPLAPGSGIAGIDDSVFANDLLQTVFTDGVGLCPLICVRDARFRMANGSDLTNLNLNVTFTQALNAIHNIPLTGSGGYLSLQKEDIKWNGTNSDDVARRGWWLSFQDPVQLGTLIAQEKVDVSAVLPQVANLVSQFLGDNPVNPGGTTINAIFGAPTSARLNIDLAAFTSANPATLSLGTQVFQNQAPPRNCYGNLKFC